MVRVLAPAGGAVDEAGGGAAVLEDGGGLAVVEDGGGAAVEEGGGGAAVVEDGGGAVVVGVEVQPLKIKPTNSNMTTEISKVFLIGLSPFTDYSVILVTFTTLPPCHTLINTASLCQAPDSRTLP